MVYRKCRAVKLFLPIIGIERKRIYKLFIPGYNLSKIIGNITDDYSLSRNKFIRNNSAKTLSGDY